MFSEFGLSQDAMQVGADALGQGRGHMGLCEGRERADIGGLAEEQQT
jgi:hypothetical protein